MHTTASQILDALNAEPQRGTGSFLNPDDTARILHEYARTVSANDNFDTQQPATAADAHQFAAHFAAYLLQKNVIKDSASGGVLVGVIRERAEQSSDMPVLLDTLGEDDFAYFMRVLNEPARLALQYKCSLLTLDELLRLDPWFVVPRDER